MGDIAKQDECERFIGEFRDDILEKYNLQLGPVQVKPSVEINPSWMTVHLYAELTYGAEVWTIMLPDVFFSADAPDRGRVDSVTEQLELEEDDAIRRLAKVQLIETVPCKFCSTLVLADEARRHDNGWVGECCWDERLKATE